MEKTVGLSVKSIPAGPELVTTEWIDQALRGSLAVRGASVRSMEIEDEHVGGGMTAPITRFRLFYDRDVPGAKRTIIAKFSTDSPIGKILGIFEREVRFYGEIAPQIPLRSPKCYYAAYDPDSGRSILLLEDLQDFRNGDWSAGCTVEQAHQAVREIALLHAPYWGDTQTTGLSWLFKTRKAWPSGMAREAVTAWDAFSRGMKYENSAAAKRAGWLVIEQIDRVVQELTSPPVTLVHNDYQPANLFFGEEDGQPAMVIADWALLSAGRGLNDVSFFLCGSISTEDRRAYEIDLLHEYLDTLEQGGVRGYSFEQLLADYHKAAILNFWRMIYATGNIAVDFDAWTPRVSRYLAALTDFFPE